MTSTLPAPPFESSSTLSDEREMRGPARRRLQDLPPPGLVRVDLWPHFFAGAGAGSPLSDQPYGLRYDEVTASNLVKIDLEGALVEPSEYGFNPAGFVIHSAIHQHREDAHCVMHTHTRAGMAIAALECGLLPVSMNGMSFHGCLAYHDYEGSTLLLEEREKLARDLGAADVLILRNHGLLSVGRTVAEAFLYLLPPGKRLQGSARRPGLRPAALPAASGDRALGAPDAGVCALRLRHGQTGVRRADAADGGRGSVL